MSVIRHPAFSVALMAGALLVATWQYGARGIGGADSVFDVWWYLRFLLPMVPIACIGLGQVAATIGRTSRAAAVLVTAVLLVSGVRGVLFAEREYAFAMRQSHATAVAVGRTVRGATEPGSVIFSMQYSGSLLFYTGRRTLRYDVMPIDWLDRSIQWLATNGAHPYALLETWEVQAWKDRFGGRANYGSLPVKPIRVIDGKGVAHYDLLIPDRTSRVGCL